MIKKISLGIIVLILIVISSLIVIAPIWYGTSTSSESDLKHHWKFEGNFDDTGGATPTQLGSVQITRGIKGRGILIEGSNNYLEVGTLNDFAGTNNFTISTWAKSNSGSAGNRHIIVSDGSIPIYALRVVQTTNYANFLARDTGNNLINIQGSTDISDDKWHHLVGVRNGTTLRLYVDGVQVNTGNDASFDDLTTGRVVAIGGDENFGGASRNFWNGSIDEVRIYNTSLTATEIYSLYNSSKSYYLKFKSMPSQGILNETPAPEGTNNETPAPTISDESGLVGHWKMNDLVNGNTTDSHISDSTQNNGSVIGATYTSDARWSGGYEFIEDDKIDIAQITFGAGSNFTLAFWAKPEVDSVYQIIFDDAGEAAGRGGVLINAAKWALRETNANGKEMVQTTSFDTSSWQFVAFTQNGTTAIAYYNGVQEGIDDDGSFVAIDQINRIGWGDGLSELGYNGKIDEVRIYNRSLSADEIKELYLSKGLVGHWTMDSKDGSNNLITPDISGYNNSGTVTGATQIGNGRWSEGYEFDGDDDGITIPNDPSLNFGNFSDFTLAYWFKTAGDASDYEFFIRKIDVGSSTYQTYLNPTNRMVINIKDDQGDEIFPNTGVAVNDNKWHHFVAVADRDASLLVYLDGAYITGNSMSSINNISNSNDLTIGFPNNGGTINGTIDEVHIYNRALDSDEVLDLYLSKGLVGHWTFDSKDGSNSTTAPDISGYGNDGILLPAANPGVKLTNEGRFKEGYYWHGTVGYSNCIVLDDSVGNFTDNFTITSWFKTNTGNGRPAISKRGASTQYDIYISGGGGVLAFYDGASAFTAATGLADGQWHFGAWVIDGASSEIYADGVADRTFEPTITEADVPVNIGAYASGGADCAGGNFNGTIDEVKIFNRALTASEIAGLYNGTKSNKIVFKSMPSQGIKNESGLVGHWTMDAKDGSTSSTVPDISGEGNDGTVTGATFTNQGRFKEGYEFDGDDFISPEVQFMFYNFTISAWIKVDSHGSSNRHFATQRGAYHFGIHSSDTLYMSVFNGSASITASGGVNVTGGVWYHVVMTYTTDTDIMTNYVDGEYNRHRDLSAFGGMVPAGNYLFVIGAEDNTLPVARNFFNGTIDEVRIYNRSLTAAEVANLYTGTKSNRLRWYSVAG